MNTKRTVSYVLRSAVIVALNLGAIAVAMCNSGCVELAYGNKIHFKTQAPDVWTRWFTYGQPVIVSGEVVNTGVDGEGVTIAEANKAQAVAQSEASKKDVEARLARIKAENNTLLIQLKMEKEQREKAEKEEEKGNNKRRFASFDGRND